MAALATTLALASAACTDSSSTSTMAEPSPPTTTVAVTSPDQPTSPGNTTEIGDLIAAFFAADESASREIARTIADRTTSGALSDLLHQHAGLPAVEPGRTRFAAPIGFSQHRPVVVRTPVGYRPDEAWPLLVVHHTWGGSADRILDRFEMLLGDSIEDYVVAAPDDYRQTVIDAPPPVTSEHTSLWLGIRKRWNVDADRMYLAGYSLGGETVVTLAAMHPGHIAAGVPMAAGFSFPSDVDGMWQWFLPNFSTVRMLHSWGSDDSMNIPGLNGRPQDITLAEQNELLDPLLSDLGLDRYEHIRLDGVGHSDAYPPLDRLGSALGEHRSSMPLEFTHRFRYIHQADAFWVEGHEWAGEGWVEPWPSIDPESGETESSAEARTIESLLGRISAEIDGQRIVVDTKHLADLTVWFSEGMTNWEQPVKVVVNGVDVFEGILEPSVEVALAQARRNYDFDRLRLAGIRIDVVSGSAHVVDPDEEFPDIVRGITF